MFLILIFTGTANAEMPILHVSMSLGEDEWRVMREKIFPPFEDRENVKIKAVNIEAQDTLKKIEAMHKANKMSIDLMFIDNMNLAPYVAKRLVLRLEKYRDQTGRDRTVLNYLSRYREVDKFLYNVFEICDAAVENYIEREFENLNINFGCTGGQHRSVFCADKLAEHLSRKYVISIKLHHREQDIIESRKGTHE